MRRQATYYMGGLAWLAAMCFGLSVASRYDNTPGLAARPAAHLPSTMSIEPKPGFASLVILAHPHCPCTRATLDELSLIMSKCRGGLSAFVYFVIPPGSPAGWERTDLWRMAASIPGVHVLSDPDGTEAGRLGAHTSGQALLYDVKGRLVFSGGITASRGHSGENAGRSAVLAHVFGKRLMVAQSSVYGCSLLGRSVGTN